MLRVVFVIVVSLAVGGCAALAGAGLGGAGGFFVAGPPGAVIGAGCRRRRCCRLVDEAIA
jgi:hypothetical protein